MKNLLTKLGSKKVIGAVLVMVTLVVGLGVVSNFSGDDQKSANEAALSNFNDNAYNNSIYSSSASRRDLERQMSAQQDKNTARFLRGKSEGIDEDDAWSSDGAYGEGVRNGEGFVYGEGANGRGGVNGAYDPSDPMYAQAGGVDENGVPYGVNGVYGDGTQDLGVDENGVPYGVNGVRGGAAGYGAAGGEGSAAGEAGAKDQSSAAAKAAKAKRDRERANKLRRATQINKLAASSGGSSWGSMGGGAAGGGAASVGSVNTDKNTRALPSTEAINAKDINANAFKMGRGGTMGGYNTARGNGAGDNNSKDGSRTAINSMLYANNASIGATKKIAEGAKSLAEDAFLQDGGNDGGTLVEDGATIREAVAELDRAGASHHQPSFDGIGFEDEYAAKTEKLEGLQQDLRNSYKKLILSTLGLALAICVLAALGKALFEYGEEFQKIIGAIIMALAALLWFTSSVYVAGKYSSISDIIDQIKSPDLSPVNDDVSMEGMRNWAGFTFGACEVALMSSLIIGLKSSLASAEWIAKIGSWMTIIPLGKIVGVLGGLGLMATMGHLLGLY